MFDLLIAGMLFALTAVFASIPQEGSVCMTLEYLQAVSEPNQFFECSPLSDQQVREYKIGDKYVGVWKRRNCTANEQFNSVKQRCIEKKKFHRQQADCSSTPNSSGCATACKAANTNVAVGNACDWTTATLQPDTSSTSHFLICKRQTQPEACGRWFRMSCAPGTAFDGSMRICISLGVSAKADSACPANSSPICSCAQQTGLSACPGQAICSKDSQLCCHILPTKSLSVEFPSTLLMNQEPLSCPGSNALPVSVCSPTASCPTGTSCNAQMRICCPIASPTSVSIVQMCPSGSPSSQPCGFLNECPKGTGCYQGACCPLTCSGGACAQQPVPICIPQIPKMPVCPNGQTSTVRCTIDQECGPAMECSSGGCCPMPFCPSGIQAVGRCLLGAGCANTAACVDGLCCPLPQCSSGGLALRICVASTECGRGFDCNNGGCCPLPSCPGGILASQRCQPGCACPGGQQCINGGCCQLPMCSSGIPAISTCGIGFLCGSGMECNNGGCCPLPICPSGAPPSQRCQTGNACPPNQICENGVCCPSPVCSNEQVAARLCGVGNSCPIGFVCEGRGCCPEPMPLCPNGGRAMQKCILGSECPPGYGCTPLGGCCLLSLEPACPVQQNAICQCSPTNACPSQATCTMGTCCAPALAAYNQVPGTQCQSSVQCNGFNSECARCVRSVCVCTNGAASNGATCLQMPNALLQQARSGCDQYGSPCKFVLSTARRKPLFAPVGNVTDEPLWFNVAARRRCLMEASVDGFDADSTCLPNEKCINGECRMKLWPGEYGCASDEECSSRCRNTYCEHKSDKNVPQCQCRNGMLLYGRCFSECPKGFHGSGAYCMHDDEEQFWMDASAQNSLNKLLNDGSC